MAERVVVAIDGPSGSGKSTVARMAAGRLGFRFLDSGAMYRALAFKAIEEGVTAADAAALLERTEIRLAGDVVYLDGRDVSTEIRTPEVSRFVSVLAAVPEVRAAMVPRQRRTWSGEDLVAEGRDIGSVVFPDAPVKIFLTADATERARRRAAQTGQSAKQVRKEQEERDARDSGREHSPLVQAPDAVELDTTGLSIEEVVERIIRLVREVSKP